MLYIPARIPQPFKIIEQAGLIVKNMHDHVAVIEYIPTPFAQALFSNSSQTLFFEFFFHMIAKRTYLRGTRTLGNHKVTAHHRLIGNVYRYNIVRFLIGKRFANSQSKFFSFHIFTPDSLIMCDILLRSLLF